MKRKRIPLQHDQWGRPEIYLAEWGSLTGGGSVCVFNNLNAAIFFVVTGLGCEVDWDNFPDPAKKYPYEDRNGNERPSLFPVFIIEQTIPATACSPARKLAGKVSKMAAMDHWIVGNGIAEMGRHLYLKATGRDEVELSGVGDRLQGKV